jgi:hypothetical protein
MTTVTPPPLPPDSGTQPSPHYCTYRLVDKPDGERGCPDWPICLFPALPPPPIEPAARALTLADWADENDEEPDDEDEFPAFAVTLASLLGIAVGLAIALGIVVLLLPVLL